MDIFAKIKRDHDEARDMMDQIIKTPNAKERMALFEALKVAILSHAKSEEKTFYNAIKDIEEWGEEVPHFKHEHKDAEKLFGEIEQCDPNDTLWWEKFGELRKALTHHMEEEEKEVFPDIKKEFESSEAKELGAEMEKLEEKMKEKLEQEVAA